jgi:hypothetical protein
MSLSDVIVVWDLDDEDDGNIRHIAEHDITPQEVEDVLLNSGNTVVRSRSSKRPITFGYTSEGRYLAVVWEEVSNDPRMIYPVTAYDAPEPA